MSRQLVERIRSHDQRAMGELYQRYVGLLSSVCYRYVPSEDDVKDVLQNSFVNIFSAIPTFTYRTDEQFVGWMVRVVVNESLDFLRVRKRLLLTDLRTVETQIADDEAPDIDPISADQLHRLISELPDGCRTVLNLYVFEGYSHKQISELMGIRPTTSATQLRYAKHLLANKIKQLISENS